MVPIATRGTYTRYAFMMVALFAILGIVLTIVAVQVYRTMGDLIAANGWIAHTYEVKHQITNALVALRDAESAERAYKLSGNAGRLADYYGALPRLAEHTRRLHGLVADNSAQTEKLKQFEALLALRQTVMNETLAVYQNGGIEALRADHRFAQALDEDHQVDALAALMLGMEDTLLAQRQSSSQVTADLSRRLTIGAIVLCFAVLALALYVILREQKRRVLSEHRVTASYRDLATSLEVSRRMSDTLRQLSGLGEMLQGCRSLEEAAAGLQPSLANLFPVAAGSINLLNASQNLVVPVGAWGEPLLGDPVFAPDDCWALRRGRAYPEDDAVVAFTCKHLDGYDPNLSHTLCAPLMAQGAMIGTLLLTAREPIDREMRSAAIAAAEQISLAVANLKLQDTLRTQSLRDPLTGLFNRRYLEVSLARDLARAIRRSQPLAVLMIDIDHFKRFNDGHGHDAGDALLAAFGELLSTLVRSEDVACRYGGEEFTIVMQETDAALALDRAEEIRRAVHTLKVQHRRQPLGEVTVSIGIASYPQHGDAHDQLLRRADRALYVAKNDGRDRVCVADR